MLVLYIKKFIKLLLHYIVPSFFQRFIKATPEYNKARMLSLYKKNPIKHFNERILFWVPGGMPLLLHIEGAIAAALRLRGYEVHMIICDGPFHACVKREITNNISIKNWHNTCHGCKENTSAVLQTLGITFSYMSSFITPAELSRLREKAEAVTWDSIDDLHYDTIHLGDNIRSAILRYARGFKIPNQTPIAREYAYSALVCAAAAHNAFTRLSPTHIFMSHGIYVDWGPALHTAMAMKIPVAAYMNSYLSAHFYFRHIDDSQRLDFHNLSSCEWSQRKRISLNMDQSARLKTYLTNRYKKHICFDMKRFANYTGNKDYLRQKYSLQTDKPVWGIMSHINWDCVCDYSPMAYECFDSWILDTISALLNLQDVQWIIKIHPAESWDNPASGVQKLIEQHYPNLPNHIRLMTAEEKISPLDFYQLINGAITVYGTAGLEIALQGKPVILAGEAHYGGKGFTHDALDIVSYRNLLKQAHLLKPLTNAQRELARRYAYCYFIQRQVPLAIVKSPDASWWCFQHDKRELLLPGNDPFIDFICDRIMDGNDFIMSEELIKLTQHDAHN